MLPFLQLSSFKRVKQKQQITQSSVRSLMQHLPKMMMMFFGFSEKKSKHIEFVCLNNTNLVLIYLYMMSLVDGRLMSRNTEQDTTGRTSRHHEHRHANQRLFPQSARLQERHLLVMEEHRRKCELFFLSFSSLFRCTKCLNDE